MLSAAGTKRLKLVTSVDVVSRPSGSVVVTILVETRRLLEGPFELVLVESEEEVAMPDEEMLVRAMEVYPELVFPTLVLTRVVLDLISASEVLLLGEIAVGPAEEVGGAVVFQNLVLVRAGGTPATASGTDEDAPMVGDVSVVM